jgi:hypothetical protein
MGQVQDDDMRELIAGALEGGASLLVRYLARGTSLTWRTALATLDADGPTRLTIERDQPAGDDSVGGANGARGPGRSTD